MPRIVLKKPVAPFEVESDEIEGSVEIVAFNGVTDIIERRSAERGFQALMAMYNIFNEYPELIGELFTIEE